MGMKLSADNFDLWVFRRDPQVEFLLLRTSQEKADRFFGGGRFWQIPTDALLNEETIEEASGRVLNEYGTNTGRSLGGGAFLHNIQPASPEVAELSFPCLQQKSQQPIR